LYEFVRIGREIALRISTLRNWWFEALDYTVYAHQ